MRRKMNQAVGGQVFAEFVDDGVMIATWQTDFTNSRDVNTLIHSAAQSVGRESRSAAAALCESLGLPVGGSAWDSILGAMNDHARRLHQAGQAFNHNVSRLRASFEMAGTRDSVLEQDARIHAEVERRRAAGTKKLDRIFCDVAKMTNKGVPVWRSALKTKAPNGATRYRPLGPRGVKNAHSRHIKRLREVARKDALPVTALVDDSFRPLDVVQRESVVVNSPGTPSLKAPKGRARKPK